MGCLFDILGSRKTFSFLNYVLSFARASGLSLSSLPPTNFTHLLFCCRCRRYQAQSLALCECMFVYICVSVFLSLYVRVCLGRLLSSYMKFSFYILHLKMVFMNGRMPQQLATTKATILHIVLLQSTYHVVQYAVECRRLRQVILFVPLQPNYTD